MHTDAAMLGLRTKSAICKALLMDMQTSAKYQTLLKFLFELKACFYSVTKVACWCSDAESVNKKLQ